MLNAENSAPQSQALLSTLARARMLAKECWLSPKAGGHDTGEAREEARQAYFSAHDEFVSELAARSAGGAVKPCTVHAVAEELATRMNAHATWLLNGAVLRGLLKQDCDAPEYGSLGILVAATNQLLAAVESEANAAALLNAVDAVSLARRDATKQWERACDMARNEDYEVFDQASEVDGSAVADLLLSMASVLDLLADVEEGRVPPADAFGRAMWILAEAEQQPKRRGAAWDM